MRRTTMKRIRFPQLSYEGHNQLVTIICLIGLLAGLGMIWSAGYYTGSVDTMVKYESAKIMAQPIPTTIGE
jgi:hypothetical protein